jgi:hypothetical protein
MVVVDLPMVIQHHLVQVVVVPELMVIVVVVVVHKVTLVVRQVHLVDIQVVVVVQDKLVEMAPLQAHSLVDMVDMVSNFLLHLEILSLVLVNPTPVDMVYILMAQDLEELSQHLVDSG